tara:strand:+ start:15587 stop:15829 length:243 start_codon:yes stop_codon:yes gene_type:complete
MTELMNVPTESELKHLQFQAMLRDHDIPNSELMYLGEREYTTEYAAHPEFHGMMMHWYLVGGEHEVPICDIHSIDRVDED